MAQGKQHFLFLPFSPTSHHKTATDISPTGYWMPFACAKAVCATFCAPIAGALIPIFGPDFPSQCTSPDAPEHGRMQIDPMIVAESVREADMFRRMYANAASAAANSHLPPLQQQQQAHHQHQQIHSSQMHHYSHGPALLSPTSISSPRLNHRRALPRYSGSPHDYDCERLSFENRMRFKRGPENSSPYMTDSEPDMQHGGGGGGGQEMHHHALAAARGGMMYSPVSPPRSSGNNGGWSVVANNNNHHQHQNTHPRHAQQQQQHVQHVSSPATAYRPSAYREPHDLSSFPSASDPLLSSIPRFGRGGNIPRLLDPQHHQLSSQPPNQQHPYLQPQTQAFPPRLPPIPTAIPSATWSHVHSGSNNSSKRPVAEILEVTDGGGDYEAYSDKSSPATTVTTNTSLSAEQQPGASGTDKSAALLLMTLSVKDVRDGGPGEAGGLYAGQVRGCGQESMSMSPVSAGLGGGQDGHRSKRQRATSM